MKLAVHYPSFSFPGGSEAIGPTIAATVRSAEDNGCAQFTVMDHWFQMEALATAQDPMLEGYTTLGFLAGQTQSIKLGLLVTGVTYRHPGLLAKTVATLDVLSGGRAELGIGAAWYDREHAGLGVPFPPIAERFERLEEALQICLQMWGPDEGPYQGIHYQLAETICRPMPLQSPRPPILIGGGGEKKTLRLVAKYADACNLFATDQAAVQHKVDVLEQHCQDVGREFSSVHKTITSGSLGPPQEAGSFVERMKPYADMGIDQVWVTPAGPDPAEWIAKFAGEVVPKLTEL